MKKTTAYIKDKIDTAKASQIDYLKKIRTKKEELHIISTILQYSSDIVKQQVIKKIESEIKHLQSQIDSCQKDIDKYQEMYDEINFLQTK